MQEYKVTKTAGGAVWYCKPGTDLLHRLDGPAIELEDGSKFWYVNDRRHREDGPAVEHANGRVEYWIEGKKYSRKAFLAKTIPVEEMTVADLEKVLGHKIKRS
jgi:hypothetical protein